ncbi:uncharacterized protein LOC108341900 isoform X5 [Vigna angularis]|uniref:uncharacterized protein LOC108341900 isoform X5 n=1 Tax=Phaseolus angularis TaxID=3914 RepID=UPI0022B39F7F|nr:uncharacterized protein LOC108341900 isoform X5 [Vigna angularis]
MNTSIKPKLHHKKPPITLSHERAEMRESSRGRANGSVKGGKTSSKDRKLALQKDVERLKKRLRREENIHRALERAFNRPLGALPRLPPYLPPYTLGLLAEVAVLEEEIVRLEEQVVHFRQDLYQEAVYMSSSKMKLEQSAGVSNLSPQSSPKPVKEESLSQTLENAARSETMPITALPKDRHGKENQTCTNSSKSSKQSICKGQTTKSPIKKLPIDNKSPQKRWDPPKKQQELRVKDLPIAEVRNHGLHDKPKGGESPNIISEIILKCLSSILLRMSTAKNLDSAGNVTHSWSPKSSKNCVEGSEFWDPYGICFELGKRDIGPYKQLCVIEAKSFDPKRTAKSLFLLHRLKLLLRKLACVNFDNLNHQEKLAFWINIYNSCMMNVRIYTASQVENELEMAKKEYLQAAVGISKSKFLIPKLLDWYLLDFAKDLESLLDWICLQLPSDVGKEAIKFLEERKTEPLSQFVQIMPHEFNFRYLLCT